MTFTEFFYNFACSSCVVQTKLSKKQGLTIFFSQIISDNTPLLFLRIPTYLNTLEEFRIYVWCTITIPHISTVLYM